MSTWFEIDHTNLFQTDKQMWNNNFIMKPIKCMKREKLNHSATKI